MRKVILIIASIAGAGVIAFAVYLSQLGLSSSSDDRPQNPSVVTESPAPGSTQAPGEERPPGEDSDQSGKPGEVKP